MLAGTERGAQAAPSAASHTLYISRWAAGAGRTRALPGLHPRSCPTYVMLRGQHLLMGTLRRRRKPRARVTRRAAGARRPRALVCGLGHRPGLPACHLQPARWWPQWRPASGWPSSSPPFRRGDQA